MRKNNKKDVKKNAKVTKVTFGGKRGPPKKVEPSQKFMVRRITQGIVNDIWCMINSNVVKKNMKHCKTGYDEVRRITG